MIRTTSFLISLFLWAIVLTLWVRSFRHADMLMAISPAGHLQGLASDRGGLLVVFTTIPWRLADARSLTIDSIPAEDFKQVHEMVYSSTAKEWKMLGFHTAVDEITLSAGQAASYRAATLPYWFLAIASGIVPIRGIHHRWRRWRWKRRGLCRGCGYDIRASSGQCPECGRVMSPESVETT